MISVAEVAARWNLAEKRGRDTIEWNGMNPVEAGATDDGFALFERGNAFDRKLQKSYSAMEIAQAAAINYQEYEGSLTHPHKADLQPIEVSKFDERTLEERGLNQDAAIYWQISGPLGRSSPWGEYRKFPTFLPDGTVGRSRLKFRSPQLQLQGGSKRSPAKTIWDKDTADLPQPIVYGADDIHEGDVVWVVNSELAVWLFWQEGAKAICTFGETIGDKTWAEIAKILLEKSPSEVNVMLDNDAAGRAGSVKAFAALRKVKIECNVVDFSGVGSKDGYDAADLWEFYDKTLRPTGARFSSVLDDQPLAPAKTLRTWKELSERPQKAAAKEQSHKTLGEVAEMVDNARFGTTQKTGVASELIGLLRANALFKTDDNDWCIVVDKNGRNVTYSLQSNDFRRWLNYRYLGAENQVLKKDEVEQICKAMISVANEEGKEIKAFYRSGYIDKTRIFVDLADGTGRVVAIDAAGWRIQDQSDVFFRNADVILPLPEPIHTPDDEKAEVWEKYKNLINHNDDRDWSLMLAWLCSALVPGWWACPILMLSGQAGSGKSSATEYLRNLVDPNKAYMVINSDNEKDIVVNAEKGRCFCLDNQSKMPGWLSDLLSGLITGTPYSCRSLFTNDEQRVFKAKRAMILTGIPDNMGREDLSDRAIKVALPVISNKQKTGERRRMNVTDLQEAWEDLRPAVLGLVFDVMSAGLRNWPDRDEIIKDCDEVPRMADFFTWVMCCEEALPVPRGTFYTAYVENIQQSAAANLEADFANCLREFLLRKTKKRGEVYEVLAKDFYDQVMDFGARKHINENDLALVQESNAPDHEKARARANLHNKSRAILERRPDWPKSSIAFGIWLTRLLPDLQKNDQISMTKKPLPTGLTWFGVRGEKPSKERGSSADVFDDE